MVQRKILSYTSSRPRSPRHKTPMGFLWGWSTRWSCSRFRWPRRRWCSRRCWSGQQWTGIKLKFELNQELRESQFSLLKSWHSRCWVKTLDMTSENELTWQANVEQIMLSRFTRSHPNRGLNSWQEIGKTVSLHGRVNVQNFGAL